MHYVHCAAVFLVREDQRMAYGKGESVLALKEERGAMRQSNEYLEESEAVGCLTE